MGVTPASLLRLWVVFCFFMWLSFGLIPYETCQAPLPPRRETLLGQGRENAKNFLQENPQMAAELENMIRAEAGLPPLALSQDLESTIA